MSQSKKPKLPTRKLLQKLLNESLFDPRNPGPDSVIFTDSNPDYLKRRAMELIRRSQAQGLSMEQEQPLLHQAIKLLAMVRAVYAVATDSKVPVATKQNVPAIPELSSASLCTCGHSLYHHESETGMCDMMGSTLKCLCQKFQKSTVISNTNGEKE